MDAFWHLARRMLRYRTALIASIVMAWLSAMSMGVGVVALTPILKSVFGDPNDPTHPAKTLRQLVEGQPRLASKLPDWLLHALPTTLWSSVIYIILGLGVLTIVGATANFLHQFLSLTVIQRTMAHLRRDAFHRVLRFPLKTVVTQGPTAATSRILVDAANVEIGLTSLLSKSIAQMFKGVAALSVALWLEWRLTLGAIILAPILYTILRKLGKKIRRASRAAIESQSDLYAAAIESMQALRVVKAHTAERLEAGRFHRLNKQVLREMFRARTAKALGSPVVEVITLIVLGGLSLIPIKMVLDKQLDPINFIVAFGALGAAAASLKPMTALLADIQQSVPPAARLKELLETPAEPGIGSHLPKLARHKASIEFRHITLTYPGRDEPALKDVSLRIVHGERIAFVGPNGCGKTTLLSLVPRLFDPDEAVVANGGAVLVDGRDIREVSVRSLRHQIGVVTQETVLFRGTIKQNIAYGADDWSDASIERAATQARAMDFIRSLPLGFETVVGEQGLNLSGGQRQRIAIARAILRDPAILILDEATSMIDADSERLISEAIGDFSHGRTCLIVAHRLSTVLNADRIVVMDAGRIVDQGKHQELLARCEVYRRIATTQMLGGMAGE